jgi:hypothetical protein
MFRDGVMSRRKMLSLDQQAQIKGRLSAIGKQLKKYPYPKLAPELETENILSELRSIMDLNIVEHYGPISLFDRCNKWLHRAQPPPSNLACRALLSFSRL